MCWIGRLCDGKVADKDVETFKVMYKCYNKYYPIFFCNGNPYEKDTVYTTKLSKEVIPPIDLKIYRGFHSYLSNTLSVLEYVIPDKKLYGIVNSVNHIVDYYAEQNKGKRFKARYGDKTVRVNDRLHFVKCIIPKGTLYYENKFGEIVSEKIIITGNEMSREDFITEIAEENNV